jgi:hypothetical protein
MEPKPAVTDTTRFDLSPRRDDESAPRYLRRRYGMSDAEGPFTPAECTLFLERHALFSELVDTQPDFSPSLEIQPRNGRKIVTKTK